MVNQVKNIRFPSGYEGSIRNRLGLGKVNQISLNKLLELAKVHNYVWRQIEIDHWLFSSNPYYTVNTGGSKNGRYTQDFDLGVDDKGMVTNIVENRSYPPDFGICEMLSNLFKVGTKLKNKNSLAEVVPRKPITFPCGKEKQIRYILGLADSDSFRRSDILRLAKFHGYETDSGTVFAKRNFRINPIAHKSDEFYPSLDLVVDNDEVVRSIVAIS